ncbi:aminotransferase [Pseudoneurospora amorphoporcata]|uniref:Aminotransferase n=1 Tax=Pseudoneurospora amorphoporcata TaxID=241081 RepID=A0AAN6NS22_9PEZI|nr:aminotransferase [Pseudoneurospora amorphoporcata]
MRFIRLFSRKAMVPTLPKFNSSHQQLNIPTSSSLKVNINTSTTTTTPSTITNMPSTAALSDPDVPTPITHPGEKKQINLLRGWPSPHLLPPSDLLSATNSLLTSPDPSSPDSSSKFNFNVPALQYGPDPGYQPLRSSLAAWLTRNYHANETYPPHGFPTLTTADQICVTGGASQNLANILAGFTDPAYTRAVWAVSPCYYLAVPIFEDAGFSVRNGKLRDVREEEGEEGEGEGVDLEELERGIREVEGEKRWPEKPVYKNPGPHRKCYKHIIYLVATSANPSGITTSLARRHALVQLARKYDALIISDDVYDFLQWPVLQSPSNQSSSTHHLPLPTPLPRLSDIDISLGPSAHDLALSSHYSYTRGSSTPNGQNHNDTEDTQPLHPDHTIQDLHFGHAVSNGSFSKLLSPGLRTGWTHSTPAFAHGLSQTGSTRSGGAPSQYCAALIHEVLSSGALEKHLTEIVRPGLQKRHALMLGAIKQELGPLGVKVIEDNRTGAERRRAAADQAALFGGYFLWLRLPESMPFSAREVAERALEEERLVVSPGENAEVSGEGETAGIRFPKHLRVCFSWEEEEDLVEGVERLGRVVRGMVEEVELEKEGGLKLKKKVGGGELKGLKGFK